PFRDRFGRPLPVGMRAAAAGMDWAEFTATFRPTDAPVRMVAWSQRRIDAARKSITATLPIGHAETTVRAGGTGTISAMTAIVYAVGFPVEINEFHQQRAGDQTATFLECSRGYTRHWVMGLGDSHAASIIDAFICAANVLSESDP